MHEGRHKQMPRELLLPGIRMSIEQKYQVELFSIKDNKVVCTEGPYELSTTKLSFTDVNINCGTNPAAWWLAAAGGAAAAIALGVRSPSK